MAGRWRRSPRSSPPGACAPACRRPMEPGPRVPSFVPASSSKSISERRRRQILRCARGQFRVEMGGAVEHVGIVRKFAVEHKQRLDGCSCLVETHATSSRRHECAILELFVGDTRRRLFQERQSLLTAALRGQGYATLGCGWSVHTRSFLGRLCDRPCRDQPTNNDRDAIPRASCRPESTHGVVKRLTSPPRRSISFASLLEGFHAMGRFTEGRNLLVHQRQG